jgi:hypothetical protein
MNANDIRIGKKYWIRVTANSTPRPALVMRSSRKDPCLFHCIGADGEGFVVLADAFLRPVQPEILTH